VDQFTGLEALSKAFFAYDLIKKRRQRGRRMAAENGTGVIATPALYLID
jgi:hypothetical protein